MPLVLSSLIGTDSDRKDIRIHVLFVYASTGKLVAAGGFDEKVTFYDTPSLEHAGVEQCSQQGSLECHGGYVSSCQFLDDSRMLTASEDGSTVMWDVAKKAPLSIFKQTCDITCLSTFPGAYQVFHCSLVVVYHTASESMTERASARVNSIRNIMGTLRQDFWRSRNKRKVYVRTFQIVKLNVECRCNQYYECCDLRHNHRVMMVRVSLTSVLRLHLPFLYTQNHVDGECLGPQSVIIIALIKHSC